MSVRKKMLPLRGDQVDILDGLFFDTEKHTDDFQTRRLPIEPDLY